MNNPETHGSVQQLVRDGEALPTVALPTEGSAPLAGEALAELERTLDEAWAKSLSVASVVRKLGMNWEHKQLLGMYDRLVKLANEVERMRRRRASVASRVLSKPGSD